ncbi:MAG: aromatic-L-amino-acid/L-tryptophan decarboxylase [Mycobacterium sp.]|jgi:aromatic-L-amino-acid decarboxylase|nr:aromatic-L-amino-acid/L-tryptophan decarboxylase [Mycobacterium sp.]MDT5286526.1 aromatic-L-amino-acid/L-tryptophan decarboxylase [Mycobacterium sp.]MDT5299892.1 aromatic-L-amino-acid/L-tryptophan decarboxylase [Mycobacterium sp.]
MTDDAAPDPTVSGWHWHRDELTNLTQAAAAIQVDILLDGPNAEAAQRRPPADLIARWAHDGWPEDGADPTALLDEVAARIAPYPFGNAHPRFSAWVNSPPHPLGAIGSGLAAALNPSVAGGTHAAVHLEHQVVRWFTDLLDWTDRGGGQLVSGGSAATLTALAVARRRAALSVGVDDRRQGLADLGFRPVVYASDQAHSCVTKAAEALGIGSANIERLRTDDHDRIDPADLEAKLTQHQSGVLPVAVVASAGTVNTGAVDPIAELADTCRRHRLWLHVDAAYGGPAVLLLDEWNDTRGALSLADSVALDPHKWLYAPVDAGLVLFRDTNPVRDTFSLVPDYLRTAGDDTEPVWFAEYGLEQTRPFRALKLWLALRHLGRRGVRHLIARDIAVATALRDAVDRAPDFELLAHGLSVVCFRHVPPWVTPETVDAHNDTTLARLQSRGVAFIAGTRVNGKAAFRACIVNPATTTEHVRALVDEIRSCAVDQ